MIRHYEVLMLATPEITKDEESSLEKDLDAVIRASNGTVSSYERWGKFKLAYPVRRNEYGIYYLARFEAPNESVEKMLKDLREFYAIKVQGIVMRQLTARLEPGAPTTYQRPKSLEESPATRDVEVFLKENKMEGLLPSVEKSGGMHSNDLLESFASDDEDGDDDGGEA